ncbi:MAG: flippase-like domain-containing protein [Gammaproteobacteria bacterium]|nr:flippase-like domain-containing protein [Gammaproteobacteria bacterium]
MKWFIRIVLSAFILCLGGWLLYKERMLFPDFKDINYIFLGLLFLFQSLFFWTTGWTFALLTRLVGVRLCLFETYGLSIINTFGNYLGPFKPGAAIKAFYLKKKRNLPYTQFLSIMGANVFLGMTVTGGTAIVLIVILGNLRNHQDLIVLICSTALFLVGLVPFFLRKGPLSRIKWPAFLESTKEGINIIFGNLTSVLLISLTYLVQILHTGIIFKVAFLAFGIEFPFYKAVFIAVFSSLSYVVAVTPNNIGIQETVSGLLALLVGADFIQGVAASSLVRVSHIAISFLLAPYFLGKLFEDVPFKIRDFLKPRTGTAS